MECEDVKKLRKMRKCADCRFYDPSPFPECHGKLAICRGRSPDGRWKIGRFTVADRSCFEERQEEKNAKYHETAG